MSGICIFNTSIFHLGFHLETITTEIFHPYKDLRSLQTISHPHLPTCLSVLIKYFIIPSTLLLLTLADGISFFVRLCLWLHLFRSVPHAV